MQLLFSAKERKAIRNIKAILKVIAIIVIALKIVNLIADKYSI